MRLILALLVVCVMAVAGTDAQSQSDLKRINQAGMRLQSEGRYAEALGYFQQFERLSRDSQPGSEAHGFALNNLGMTLRALGRYQEARPALEQALEIARRQRSNLLTVRMTNVALIYEAVGKFKEAETLYREALAIDVARHGDNHRYVAIRLAGIAGLLKADQAEEKERLYKRALEIMERSKLSSDLYNALNNLGVFLSSQSRFDEAEVLLKRALEIIVRDAPKDHPQIGTALENLAAIYRERGDFRRAEQAQVQALQIMMKHFDETTPSLSRTLINTAGVLVGKRRYDQAEVLAEQALKAPRKVHGEDHPAYAGVLSNLSFIQLRGGQYATARAGFERATDIFRKAYGADSKTVALNEASIAFAMMGEGRNAEALALFRRAAVQIDPVSSGRDGRLTIAGELESEDASPFEGYVAAAFAASLAQPEQSTTLSIEAFEVAQRALSSAAAFSMQQTTLRLGTGDSDIAAAIRQQQDLSIERAALNAQLVDSFSHTGNDGLRASLRKQIASIEAEIGRQRARIERDFPKLASTSGSVRLAAGEVRNRLSAREAVLLVLPGEKATFVWAITKDKVSWARADIGAVKLYGMVLQLRRLIGAPTPPAAPVSGQAPLPFKSDLATAHELYQLLLAPLAKTIAGKELLIVGGPAVAALPWQMLVISPPPSLDQDNAHGKTHWLVRDHAVTVLPSVSALQLTEITTQRQAVAANYLGLGNPLLAGADGKNRSAWSGQVCRDWTAARSVEKQKRSSAIASVGSTKGSRLDPAKLRLLEPLPDTTEELCSIARLLGANEEQAVLLGERATEAAIKRLNARRALATVSILHFATHGLVAGEVDKLAEPSLVLSPPITATTEDDGVLTASEIAFLDLNGTFVILSACNTASGNSAAAEPLSGLARAFLYAGARTLLVSHWAVDSVVAVRLMKGMFEVLQQRPNLSRAEALRQSMLAMIASAEPDAALPINWAPFFIVGAKD